MKLRCPHNKQIKITKTLGVVIYEHAIDDKSCEAMNKFTVTTDYVVNLSARSRKYANTRDVRASLRGCQQACTRLFNEMGKTKNLPRLEEMFQTYAAAIGTKHLSELVSAFGQKGIDNLEYVMNKTIRIPSDLFRKLGQTPRHNVASLKAQQVSDVLDDIKRSVDKHKEVRASVADFEFDDVAVRPTMPLKPATTRTEITRTFKYPDADGNQTEIQTSVA